jgi:hypothetical protein
MKYTVKIKDILDLYQVLSYDDVFWTPNSSMMGYTAR